MLTVVYDERCSLCVRCRDWLASEDSYVPLQLVAACDAKKSERLGRIPWLARELVAVDGEGRVWAGAAAFLVCFWALRRYRFLASLAMCCLPVSTRLLGWVSTHRDWLSRTFFGELCEGAHCGIPANTAPYR